MRKIKTILGIVFSLAIVTTMNTTVFAANDSGIPERRGVYIRECVGYEPNYTNIDYTHKLLGSVSGDNTQGSSPMQITYQYEQSGTTTASIAGYANGTTEANVVFAKMQAEVGVEVTGSRSWTKGTSAGVSYSIAQEICNKIKTFPDAIHIIFAAWDIARGDLSHRNGKQ